jgi:hypothetical protein
VRSVRTESWRSGKFHVDLTQFGEEVCIAR